ncbi:endonuclease/exonuclease/phosphatase family protein [Planctomicrobium sp. SH664]|uniref:endonuclease/exonuclease/phosphatase family protein n=1 Tax=Planctomicrobium sp. SH664 TaxID=3448125 RepID=UPI003F5BC746
MLALFWRQRRWWGWRCGALVCGCFVSLFLEEPRSLTRSIWPMTNVSPARQSFVVVSLNCASGREAGLADLLPHQPDLVLLQESPSQEVLQRWSKELFEDDGSVAFGRDCSIIARGNLKPLPVPAGAPDIHCLWNSEKAGAVQVVSVRLTPPDVRLDYWNPACWKAYANLQRQQEKEARLISEATAAVPLPAIVGGDWNCPAGGSCDDLFITAGFQDAFRSSGRGWGKTIVNEFPFHRIDRILHTADFASHNTTASKTIHSDHRAVVTVLTIRVN